MIKNQVGRAELCHLIILYLILKVILTVLQILDLNIQNKEMRDKYIKINIITIINAGPFLFLVSKVLELVANSFYKKKKKEQVVY